MLPSSSTPWNPATTAILPLVERGVDGARVDGLDARARERAVGQDADLVAEERDARLPPSAWMASATQADRDLLAGRGDDVELALVGDLADLLGELSRRLVSPDIAETMTTTSWPLRCVARQRARDVPDALDGADRGAAVFLHDEQGARHFSDSAAGVVKTCRLRVV